MDFELRRRVGGCSAERISDLRGRGSVRRALAALCALLLRLGLASADGCYVLTSIDKEGGVPYGRTADAPD
eukprot:scaffold2723_cov108-Isochrysis_galbana.AAC.9